jgi:hypothetical protein
MTLNRSATTRQGARVERLTKALVCFCNPLSLLATLIGISVLGGVVVSVIRHYVTLRYSASVG